MLPPRIQLELEESHARAIADAKRQREELEKRAQEVSAFSPAHVHVCFPRSFGDAWANLFVYLA